MDVKLGVPSVGISWGFITGALNKRQIHVQNSSSGTSGPTSRFVKDFSQNLSLAELVDALYAGNLHTSGGHLAHHIPVLYQGLDNYLHH